MRELLLKLTRLDDSIVLIGVESIIDVKDTLVKDELCSKIQSRGVMV